MQDLGQALALTGFTVDCIEQACNRVLTIHRHEVELSAVDEWDRFGGAANLCPHPSEQIGGRAA
ncbi:hypothetical protein D3C81_896880 [compost metagenome]